MLLNAGGQNANIMFNRVGGCFRGVLYREQDSCTRTRFSKMRRRPKSRPNKNNDHDKARPQPTMVGSIFIHMDSICLLDILRILLCPSMVKFVLRLLSPQLFLGQAAHTQGRALTVSPSVATSVDRISNALCV